MESLISESVRQYGLPVGLLLALVIILSRVVLVVVRELKVRYEKELADLKAENAELKIERDLYRDRWIETLGAAEIGERATRRLAGGGRRSSGDR